MSTAGGAGIIYSLLYTTFLDADAADHLPPEQGERLQAEVQGGSWTPRASASDVLTRTLAGDSRLGTALSPKWDDKGTLPNPGSIDGITLHVRSKECRKLARR